MAKNLFYLQGVEVVDWGGEGRVEEVEEEEGCL